jgi:uncharacterized membrane protein YgdD (TMEM256/DUF423 family)
MNFRSTLITGIVLAILGVMIGAFGAHGLKQILEVNNRTDTFELAVRYQFYHAFALMITGILQKLFPLSKFTWVAPVFIAGILLFSGSLYILSLTGITILGAVTPFGGVMFILGWILLLSGVARQAA